ncbi:MAG: isochorismatase family cysteine hydrolase [Bacteroidales bacterium]|nr:isochorismatase family cysteine hydrolase [Bacteroidales bacterium]
MKKSFLWIVAVLLLVIIVLGGNLIIFEMNGLKVSQGSPIAKYASDHSALLVIDIQEYTTGELAENESYKKSSDSLIRKLNRIIDSAFVRNIAVIYVRSEVSNVLVNLINNSLAKGSKGVALDKRLNVVPDFIITKQQEDAFSNPRLDSILISQKVNRLYVTGLDASHCVKSTMQAAQNRGYNVMAINDAILAVSDSLKTKMLGDYKASKINVINSADFFNSSK